MMHRDPIWQPLLEALDGATARNPVRLWLRDDDAVTDTPSLRRLAALCERYRVPLVLAVIPAHADASLGTFLAGSADVTVAVHGWAHTNHAPAGQKACELGNDRPRAMVHQELADGLARLRALVGDALRPVLVPPWNRIDDAVVDGLERLGFEALSTFGWPDEGLDEPLKRINIHIDLIDWKRGRVGRDHASLATALAAEIGVAQGRGGQPVGVLSHHLAMDETAWEFLHALLALTGERDDVVWIRVC